MGRTARGWVRQLPGDGPISGPPSDGMPSTSRIRSEGSSGVFRKLRHISSHPSAPYSEQPSTEGLLDNS